ncbi:hypothetical protein [Poseidonocella sp. HB161398]|uniref:hypothetical protein n=1 Tax=Poseidonocella sp. HB161398 TaxID=2320855 RepID=UPI001108CABB|nr:hypothetical protein [Poseidonocella sp. HB161398]
MGYEETVNRLTVLERKKSAKSGMHMPDNRPLLPKGCTLRQAQKLAKSPITLSTPDWEKPASQEAEQLRKELAAARQTTGQLEKQLASALRENAVMRELVGQVAKVTRTLNVSTP